MPAKGKVYFAITTTTTSSQNYTTISQNYTTISQNYTTISQNYTTKTFFLTAHNNN